MENKITLVDGYGLIYRSYFAFIRNPLINKEGKNVSVVFGFFNTLSSFIHSNEEQRFAVVLDSKTPTFRHKIYKEYKANREKAPDDLHAQIPIVEEILKKLEIPILQQDGFEADDILATIATKCSQEKIPCEIITGDKDLLQLVDDYVTVLKPDKGKYLPMHREEVIFQWGVTPEQILDFLSLIGDKADNVPGVMGIGEKGAEKMLKEFPTLDAIYENIGSFTPAIQKKLEASRENAFLSRTLITLKTDLAFSPADIQPHKIHWETASDSFIEVGVPSLAKRGQSDATTETKRSPSKITTQLAQAEAGVHAVEGPGGIWQYEFQSPWKEELQEGEWECLDSLSKVEEELKRAAKAQKVAFDCETNSLVALESTVVGFSFCYNDQKAFYVPLFCQGQEVLPNSEVKALLKSFFATPELKIIGQNYKFDYKAIKHWGAEPCDVWADTLIAAWLIDSDLTNYNMDFLASRYLNYKTIKFTDIVAKDQTFDQVELSIAAKYAAEDALITWRLWIALETFLQKANLTDLFFNIEMKITAILAEMECNGISLDRSLLSFFSKKLETQIQEIEKQVYEECGHEFNLNSPKQLQEVLFNELGLPPGKKTKTGYSTDTAVLQSLAHKHIVPSLILRNRSLSKLKSTYADALPLLINPETGRIHTHFIQTGTATGRLSSRDPNLQNIPVKEEEGRTIRKAFLSEEGKIFLSADYSQIELAVLASLSADPNLCAAFKQKKDIHRHTASLIFAKDELDITAQERRIAKTINFGVIYGMSAFRLSQELQIPMMRAQNFISTYFATYNGIQTFINQTIAKAKETGYVTTQAGHVRRINGINSRNKTEEAGASRVAVNTVIQGTAADIVKRAMIAISERLSHSDLKAKLLLQIHDELLFELPIEEEEAMRQLVEEEMLKAAELSIPVSVSIETGNCWGNFH